MQRHSADFPRDSAGSAAFEGILALVARDRGARPFASGLEPWIAREMGEEVVGVVPVLRFEPVGIAHRHEHFAHVVEFTNREIDGDPRRRRPGGIRSSIIRPAQIESAIIGRAGGMRKAP